MAIPPTNIRILFTNYDIITYFLNLAFCSEHFISIKHRILATFDINKKINSDSLYAFNVIFFSKWKKIIVFNLISFRLIENIFEQQKKMSYENKIIVISIITRGNSHIIYSKNSILLR